MARDSLSIGSKRQIAYTYPMNTSRIAIVIKGVSFLIPREWIPDRSLWRLKRRNGWESANFLEAPTRELAKRYIAARRSKGEL